VADGENAPAVAGWYDDGSGRLRYWGGAAWTDLFADTLPTPVTQPRRRVLWPWLVAGGGVLLSAIIVVLVLASSLGQTPQATVQRFSEARWHMDCDSFQDVITPRLRGELELEGSACAALAQAAEFYEGARDFSVTITSMDINGDSAVVEVAERGNGEYGEWDVPFIYYLFRLDGRWLVDSVSENYEPF
jgi:hypothetical protein